LYKKQQRVFRKIALLLTKINTPDTLNPMNEQPTSKNKQKTPVIPTFPKKYWDNAWIFFAIAILFWGLEFILQYFWLSAGQMDQSLVRSCALAGATFFASAMLCNSIFKLFPRTARHWQLRRHFSVSAFVFLTLHSTFVTWFYYKFNLANEYSSLHPLENPIVFGALAMPLLFVMAATSTEYAMNKLTPKVWKAMYRLVYLAFILALFHIGLTNPLLLVSPPGYLLIALLVAAAFSQLYWFFNNANRQQ
jgi:DMSO/TMAO reductase YedYZ heme-binding membrane subunit